MKKSKFIEIVKKLIERERKLKEASTTVTAGGSYMTPKAFSKKKDGHKDPEEGGYKKVREGSYHQKQILDFIKDHGDSDYKPTIQVKGSNGNTHHLNISIDGLKKLAKLMLKEGKYHDYRNDETLTPKQKIGHSMREVRNALSELNKLIDMNVRLKNELNVDSRSYWKNTHKALGKISERLVKLANKVGKLQ